MTESHDGHAKAQERANKHADGSTRRPETPELEGRAPLPEELTGRASGTDEDLVALMRNQSDTHLADGFRGGSSDEDIADSDATGTVKQHKSDEPIDARAQ
jgi:hypothetical protein